MAVTDIEAAQTYLRLEGAEYAIIVEAEDLHENSPGKILSGALDFSAQPYTSGLRRAGSSAELPPCTGIT